MPILALPYKVQRWTVIVMHHESSSDTSPLVMWRSWSKFAAHAQVCQLSRLLRHLYNNWSYRTHI